MKQESKSSIRVSVRNFVEFLLRTGDIDNRRGNLNQADAMLEGSRIHRKIQTSMAGDYRAEVTLKLCKKEPDYDFILEGRADGIIQDDKGVMIDEIKGVYRDLEDMKEPVEVHLGQAKCYAYMYATQEKLDTIRVQMTYCNLDTEEILRFVESYSIEELTTWFEGLYKEYQKWIQFRMEARDTYVSSVKELEFPFTYRKGQKELVRDVYLSVLRKKTLYIQAPTGVGKTLCTVFPSVKAAGEQLASQIFYLTAKTITRTAAGDAFSLLIDQGLRARVLTITAKDKVCPLEERSCNPVDCPYAKGYFDRVNDCVYEYIAREGIYDRESLIGFALEKQLCPFEFSLDVSLWCDAVICDYNYVFDPNVYLKRFFAEGIKGDYIFLVDEAHNMIERAREMYSAVLYKESFLEIKRLMKEHSRRVAKALDKCNKLMLEYKRKCDTYQVIQSFSPFVYALMQLSGELDLFFKNNPEFDGGDEFSQFYLDLRHFLNMCDIMDENYTVYTEHDENGKFKIKLYCIDTAAVLQRRIDMARSTVYFSATLLPIRYYKSMLSEEEDAYAVYAKTAFLRQQSEIFVATDVSSKYTRRGTKEYMRIAAYIQNAVKAKAGHYMVFFPSYKFMRDVYEVMPKEDMEILLQESAMTEEEREAYLNRFGEEETGTVVGFCVMGGIFSEGIDLRGNQLIGAIIVGTGLPQISNERDVLKNHYDEKGQDGFQYAFRYPGMNKVLQAAGRVIRTLNDKGVILLLDERFHQREYRELFPREWDGYKSCTVDNIEKQLEDFWN
ncbi:MAG: ATP-dependent DNA helicase [Lachnospiraceae bacterium]|nr:ATP-dependent DNA helicase [Lachnospiraceae bacterium]